MPDNYKYGGGASESLLHPVMALLMLLAIVCILFLPRKYVSLPLLWMVLLVPGSQQIYIAGVHLFALRLVVLFGVIRMFISSKGPDGKLLPGGTNGIDRAFLMCILFQAISVVLLFHEGQAVINQASFLWDWLGGYFVIRWTLQNEDDVYRTLKYLALLFVPVAIVMIVEQTKMFNLFSIFGGVPAAAAVRDGTIRSAGVFAHPIIAGTISAVMVPLFLLLWKSGHSKLLGAVGLISASIMTWTSNSSTCLSAYAAALFALLFWPLRKSMKKVRWGIVFALCGLQLVMKAPVWFLIARVDLTGGSSSYHRAELVDQFITHFRDWWLIGVASSSAWGLDMWDVQNQYANVGETGGLLAFIFFILVISRSFARIGNARKIADGDKDREWSLWLLGSALFANVVAFFGVNYFDQSRMLWFLVLAVISAFTVSLPELQASKIPATGIVPLRNGLVLPVAGVEGSTFNRRPSEQTVGHKPQLSGARQSR
jgi:hypothetical protein